MMLVIALLTAVFAGWNILRLVSFKRAGALPAEELLTAYGLGIGAISLQMLLFYFLNVRYTILTITVPWIALFILNMRSNGTGVRDRLKDGENRPVIEKLLVLGISLEVAYAFFRALIKPIESYDAVAIYAIKAKIFYLAQSIPSDYFTRISALYPHPDYPLCIPLAETFIYTFLGSFNDQLVKMIFPLFFVGILGMLYFAVRRFASRAYALLFTFLLASIPQFNSYAANAYQDLPLAYYYFVSAIFLFRWMEDRSRSQYLVVSAVMAGLAGWTKNEGMMYCVVNTAVIFAFALLDTGGRSWKTVRSLAVYLSIIFVIMLPWTWIKKTSGIVNGEIELANLNPSNMLKQIYKIVPIFYEFQKQFFGPKKWNILFPAAAFIMILNYKKLFQGTGKYIFISLALSVAGYCVFYMISLVEINYFLSKTWSRFLIHFLPVLVYYLATLLKEDVKL
ncbi:MAG: glycosyltransferase family 39 protein [Candidatus Omnitrophota bacterium]